MEDEIPKPGEDPDDPDSDDPDSQDASDSEDGSDQSDDTDPGDDSDSADESESTDDSDPDDSEPVDAKDPDDHASTDEDDSSTEDDNAPDSSGEPDANQNSDDDDANNLVAANDDANNFSSQPVDQTVAPCPSENVGGATMASTPPPASGLTPPPPPVLGNLEVTVTDSKTGKTIEGAKVSISGPATQNAQTTPTAKFNGIPTGGYTLKAEATGYTTENGTATVVAAKTANASIPLTPITVAIALDKPVACPGHPLAVTAAGTPPGGTFAWEITGAKVDLVDAAGAPIRAGAGVNLLGFDTDTSTGTIKELSATIKVTYTFTNGQTATDSKDVKIHEIKFKVTDKTINKSDTTVLETATTITMTFGAAATMSTNPQIEIQLDAACPRKSDCASNHRVGWLQTVLTFQADFRYTHTLLSVTSPLPIRDSVDTASSETVTKPFYLEPVQFAADKEKKTAHHVDSPGFNGLSRVDPRPAAPAPPPPKNRQLRQIIRTQGFTAWLVVQNKEWSAHDLAGSFAFQGNFDWSMGMTVSIDLTAAAGRQATPKKGPPTVPATISSGKGGGTPNIDPKFFNKEANLPANIHIDPAPEI